MFVSILQSLRKFSTISSVPGMLQKNPYLHLPTPQLLTLIELQLKQSLTPNPCPQKLNKLIQMGAASKLRKLRLQQMLLSKKCIKMLNEIQRNINRYEEQAIKKVEFQELVGILEHDWTNGYQFVNLTDLYLNSYCHLLEFHQILAVYEYSLTNSHLHLINQTSLSLIQKHVQFNQLDLKNFIKYLRLFPEKFNAQRLQSQLQKYPKSPQLTQEQKTLLYYLTLTIQPKLTKLLSKQYLNVEPELVIQSDQNQKYVCMKMEILKKKGVQLPDLSFIDIRGWDFQYLVWISEFCNNSSHNFKELLHAKVLSNQLSSSTNPQSILIYAKNINLTPQKHTQLSSWLCMQPTLTHAHEQALCRMLVQINDQQWHPYYQDFYLHVLRLSLGNFKWESQNIVYYFGIVFGVKDDNMEYLRRYILNTYAALGTARREIPTSSYFYKILEITKPEQFYKDL